MTIGFSTAWVYDASKTLLGGHTVCEALFPPGFPQARFTFHYPIPPAHKNHGSNLKGQHTFLKAPTKSWVDQNTRRSGTTSAVSPQLPPRRQKARLAGPAASEDPPVSTSHLAVSAGISGVHCLVRCKEVGSGDPSTHVHRIYRRKSPTRSVSLSSPPSLPFYYTHTQVKLHQVLF